jgi:two-component system, NarL family, nitrate/nitrite response regulator NarL
VRRQVLTHPHEPVARGSPRDTVRVFIVGQEQLFAEAVSSSLESFDLNVVGIAGVGREGLEGIARERPDLVLLEMDLPDGSGLVIGAEIARLYPETKVVALTSVDDIRVVRQALRLGFDGYITKDANLKQLVRSIMTVMGGEAVVPRRATARLGGGLTDEERHAALLAAQLTSREREILALLVAGASSPEIALAFGVTHNTLRSHIQSILMKLQVHSRLQAAAFAVRFGIVDARHRSVSHSREGELLS